MSLLTDYCRQLNVVLVLVTLLVFSGLIKLGLWQHTRAIEKELRLERIASLQKKGHLSSNTVAQLLDNNEDINDLPVALSGHFDSERVFLLDNQVNQGKQGYRVLQTFQSDLGLVLVNLGWIQAPKLRTELPDFQAVSGFHQIKANIRIIEQGIVLQTQNYDSVSWPLRVQQIELDKFSQIIGQKLLPFVLYLDTKEDIGFVKQWQPIVMPPQKHRGYSVQWFSLAAAWLLLMFSASVRAFRINKQNNNNKV